MIFANMKMSSITTIIGQKLWKILFLLNNFPSTFNNRAFKLISCKGRIEAYKDSEIYEKPK